VQTRMYEGRPQIVASVGYSESGVKKPCDFCLFSGAEPPEVSMMPRKCTSPDSCARSLLIGAQVADLTWQPSGSEHGALGLMH